MIFSASTAWTPVKLETKISLGCTALARVLTGNESAAVDLVQRVLADAMQFPNLERDLRCTVVGHFSRAYRLFAGNPPSIAPPARRRRVASLERELPPSVRGFGPDLLLGVIAGVGILPQRAALAIFYTAGCSIADIAAVLAEKQRKTRLRSLPKERQSFFFVLNRDDRPTESGGQSSAESNSHDFGKRSRQNRRESC